MKTVRFGRFVLDVDRRLLLEDGRPVHLSPKGYELLALLAERRPAAVSKAEIRDHLWPDTFVADVGLATVVNEVRRALGQRGRGPGVLRTVHGYGYAFEAPQSDRGDDAPPAAAPAGCVLWLSSAGREYPLRHGENLIGRTADVGVRLDNSTVSKHHARICVEECRASIEDLGSKNGTFLRGRRIMAAAALEDGDVIRIGEAEVIFHNLAAPGATATVRA